MITLPVVAAILLIAAQDAGGPSGLGTRDAPRLSANPGRPGADAAAEEFLRHSYTVYLSIRGCTEASRELGKPEFLPTVSIDEARRAMRNVDLAAKEVGLDVDRIWAEALPVGIVTAEAVKADTPANMINCSRMGGVFRVDLANLQNALKELGSNRPLMEKDF